MKSGAMVYMYVDYVFRFTGKRKKQTQNHM